MSRLSRTILAAILGLALTAPAVAQTAPKKDSTDTAEQFKSGAQQIGDGAKQIGEGIKRGAIETWEALKAGASAAAAKFNSKPDHAAGSAGSAGSGR